MKVRISISSTANTTCSSDKEYEDYVDARAVEIFSYYSDEHFEETALYNLAMKEVVKWPNVITFDDGRRAYPVDK